MTKLTVVDKMEAMLGSYGPNPAGQVYTKIVSPDMSFAHS